MRLMRSYWYLLKPNHTQKEKIRDIFECRTLVTELYIRDLKEGKDMNRLTKDILNGYKERNLRLIHTDTAAMMGVLFDLSANHDDLRSSERKKRHHSYTTPNYKDGIRIISRQYVTIPKAGKVRLVYHRDVPEGGVIRNATVSENSAGEFHISLLVSIEKKVSRGVDSSKIIGLDYSSANLFVDSEGCRMQIPHFRRNEEKRLAVLNSRLSSCRKGSEHYRECRHRIASLHKHIAARRLDYLHKLSTRLADRYDVICVEDLDMIEIAHYKNLAKATYDNSYGLFLRMLRYKLEDRGKKLVVVDRWYPLSKLCSKCGYQMKELSINDRTWICPHCGSRHDRDVNAAINIRNKGRRQLSEMP